MMAAIYIEPHERYEAIEAYRDRLTAEQVEQIEDASGGAIVLLQFGIGEMGTWITVIEKDERAAP